ncbi:uncharacterized protein PADG_06495 [Paracoccidioides brasiliensis Pb18]|uniref:Uncharacterized protein n=1 Tax=Paracoccidioides brasiliensis (strain Pb18) TaxID=502780 RepID=C1GGQ8_PARBD|nr:uncharacterized protein PADG_06495 [Paracoccidioides brasiliensis Pb18]EEH50416.2 hypothetical protein PADG_06495 [Paracoccidioides brasiliensis Pb18]
MNQELDKKLMDEELPPLRTTGPLPPLTIRTPPLQNGKQETFYCTHDHDQPSLSQGVNGAFSNHQGLLQTKRRNPMTGMLAGLGEFGYILKPLSQSDLERKKRCEQCGKSMAKYLPKDGKPLKAEGDKPSNGSGNSDGNPRGGGGLQGSRKRSRAR